MTFFKTNVNARAHAKELVKELSIAIQQYLDFKNDLTYEQACELTDLRRTLNNLGVYEVDEQ